MIDSCHTPQLLPFEQAKDLILKKIENVAAINSVALVDSLSRVLANDIESLINVPVHNNSAMDGYAFCNPNNTCNEFKLVGTAMAGSPYIGELSEGECIRIMTGAIVPEQATSVEMQENIIAEGAKITPTQPIRHLSNIRFAGEDIKQGQTVFCKGHRLNSLDIGLIASLGIDRVNVFKRPKVAIFSTGDELKLPGQPLSSGEIYESNRYVLTGMLKKMDVEVLDFGVIPDDKKVIETTFFSADKQADIIICSGGVSVGDADYTKEVLDELGDIDFWKVAIKPGKPFAFGQLTNSYFFGLPGNPVSATVTFHQLAAPAIRKFAGQTPKNNLRIKAVTTEQIKKRPGRMDFQRGVAHVDITGGLKVTPFKNQGSGVLSSMSLANCYIILEQESAGYLAQENVYIELFDDLIS